MSERLRTQVLDKLAKEAGEFKSWKDATLSWQKGATRFVPHNLEDAVDGALLAAAKEVEKIFEKHYGSDIELDGLKELRGRLLAENSEAKKR